MILEDKYLEIGNEWVLEKWSYPFKVIVPNAKSDIIRFSLPFSTSLKEINLMSMYNKITNVDSSEITYAVMNDLVGSVVVTGCAYKVDNDYKLIYDIKLVRDEFLVHTDANLGFDWIEDYLKTLINNLGEQNNIHKFNPLFSYTVKRRLPKSFFTGIKVTKKGFTIQTPISSKVFLGTRGVVTSSDAKTNSVMMQSGIVRIKLSDDLKKNLESACSAFKGKYAYLSSKHKDIMPQGTYRLLNRLPSSLKGKNILYVLRVDGGTLRKVSPVGGKYSIGVGDFILRKIGSKYTLELLTSVGYLLVIKNDEMLCKDLQPLIGVAYKVLYSMLFENTKPLGLRDNAGIIAISEDKVNDIVNEKPIIKNNNVQEELDIIIEDKKSSHSEEEELRIQKLAKIIDDAISDKF